MQLVVSQQFQENLLSFLYPFEKERTIVENALKAYKVHTVRIVLEEKLNELTESLVKSLDDDIAISHHNITVGIIKGLNSLYNQLIEYIEYAELEDRRRLLPDKGQSF